MRMAGSDVTAVGLHSTLHHVVRERTTEADMVRHALQTYAERRHLTPCSSSPEDKRPAVPSMIRKAMEPPALCRAYRG